MATVAQGSSAEFTLDAYGYVTITQCGAGTLAGVSHAPKLRSDVNFTKIAPIQYGPFGVPMDMTLTATDGGSITYTTTGGYGGTFTQQDGRDYLIGPSGALFAITPIVGTYGQAEIAGTKQAVVTLDSGNDANAHGDWAITYDCTLAGNPGVPDESLAGERFERADPNEIIISGLPGNVMAGIVYFPEFTTLSMVHIAQLGGSNYANSGTATAGLNQFVRLDLPDGTIGLEIQAREPTGANGRYRQIVFTPFMSRE